MAVQLGVELPGVLLVNILPRNFYHIDQLQPYIEGDRKIIFEVSEGEAINNLDLLLSVRRGFQIAMAWQLMTLAEGMQG